MDNVNFVSKKLVAEYKENEDNDFKVIERAYIQGNNKFIIEYEGGKQSMYAVAIDFFNSEARNGAYSLDREKFELWQKIRRKLDEENRGIYKEFALNEYEELEIDLNDYFIENTDNEHEKNIGKISDDDLPF